jgi:tRNA G18 (ribose-2'-O)-methylase SpoU
MARLLFSRQQMRKAMLECQPFYAGSLMLNQIRIILVGTTHTGNIGSVARAMKTMGLSELYLVAPKELPDGQAYALSAGASDILANAKVFDTLQQAISDCALVVGSSARSRTLSWPMLEPRECGVKAVQEAEKQPVALVFGRESSGLTNELPCLHSGEPGIQLAKPGDGRANCDLRSAHGLVATSVAAASRCTNG